MFRHSLVFVNETVVGCLSSRCRAVLDDRRVWGRGVLILESMGLTAYNKHAKTQKLDIVRFLWKCMHMQWVW